MNESVTSDKWQVTSNRAKTYGPDEAILRTPDFGPRTADWFSRPLAVPPTLPRIVIGGFKGEREEIGDE